MEEKSVITIKEVRFAIKACNEATRRRHEAEAAEETKAASMMGVFERLLGVKSSSDVSQLSPADIAKLAKQRVKRGDVELEGFELETLLKVIQQSSCRRNVGWKDALIAECGESKAAELQAATAQSYSYKFVEQDEMPRAHARALGAVNV
jgi:hypothetical protein